jgi:hypothetical protein
MTAHALITGTLFRAPEQRTAKSGKPFVAATLKVKDGEATQWDGGEFDNVLLKLSDILK